MAGDDPRRLEELLLLFVEDLLVRVKTRVDVVAGRETRGSVPLRFALAHQRYLRRFHSLPPAALAARSRASIVMRPCSWGVSRRNMCVGNSRRTAATSIGLEWATLFRRVGPRGGDRHERRAASAVRRKD